MKKLLLLTIIVVIVVALLPFLGNRVVKSELDNNIQTLTSYGIEVAKSSEEATYLSAKKHYEFLVKDSKKFLKYLEQFSDNQLPPYIDAALAGVLVGVDLEYSNFLFSDEVSADIYPLSLSSEMMEGIKKEDKDFYKYLKTLLESRGVLYHINYKIVSEGFDGYIKDIKEEYLLQDGSKIVLNISDAIFDGTGSLIAPTTLNSTIQKIGFNATHDGEEFSLVLNDFTSNSNFKSHSTYTMQANLQSLEYKISGTKKSDVLVDSSDISVNISSNIEGEKAEFDAKSSFKELEIKTQTASFLASGLNYVLRVSDVDKDALEGLRVLLSRTKSSYSNSLQDQIEKSTLNLFSKGLRFDIEEFSLANFSIKDKKDIDGFKIKVNIVLKEDVALHKKSKPSPLSLLQNITLDAKLKFSKEMMAIIYKEVSLSKSMKNYAVEEGDNVVFNVKFLDKKLSINGKQL
ncbi:MAG: DUF945 family protein [Campylobacterota bacterium]|nr:DUF945 family protein [Campylobacterota bacterium]